MKLSPIFRRNGCLYRLHGTGICHEGLRSFFELSPSATAIQFGVYRRRQPDTLPIRREVDCLCHPYPHCPDEDFVDGGEGDSTTAFSFDSYVLNDRCPDWKDGEVRWVGMWHWED